jgi:RIO kinase 1
MRIPERLVSLADQGIIDEVVRPLMSGKEAEVFLIRSGGELRVAKVYKDAQNRTFKNRAEYTEGRKVRNSRDQRAIDKRSRHGRAQDEAAWRSTEVDMIYRLRDAGVRVPTPHHFIDGVLIMELVCDADGNPAPRLGELRFTAVEATQIFDQLLTEAVRMLCAGVVHGDLSDFNVLMGADGPVVIDFPQAVDASSNQNARKLLLRDVGNLQRFLSKFSPQPPRPHAAEMWDLYTRSLLTPETRLRGQFRAAEQRVDTAALLELIGDANHDERRRRESQGLSMRGIEAAPPGDNRGFQPRGPRQDNRGGQPRQAPQQGDQRNFQPQQAPQGDQRNFQPQQAPQQGDQRNFQPRQDHRDAQPRQPPQQGDQRNFQPRQDHRDAQPRQVPQGDQRNFQPRQDHRDAQPRQPPQQGDQRNFQPRQPPQQGDQRNFQPRQDHRDAQPRQAPQGDQRNFQPRQDHRDAQPRQPQQQGDQRNFQPRRDDRDAQPRPPHGEGGSPPARQQSTTLEIPTRSTNGEDAPRRRRVEVVVVPSGPRGRSRSAPPGEPPSPEQGQPAPGPADGHRRRAAR